MVNVDLGGIFLSGAAEARENRLDTELKQSVLNLEQSDQEFEQRQQLRESIQEQEKQAFENTLPIIEKSAKVNNKQAIERAIQNYAQIAGTLFAEGQKAGILNDSSTGLLKNRLQALVASAQTPEQIGQAEGRQEAAKDLVQIEAGTKLPPQVSQNRNVLLELQDERAVLRKTRERLESQGKSRQANNIQERIAEIDGRIQSLQASETFDPRNITSPSDKAREKAQENLREAASDKKIMDQAMTQLKSLGFKGAGIPALAIEKVGGLITQLPKGDDALKAAGIDVAEVQEFRTTAQIVLGRTIDEILGEKGKFTDFDRRLVQKAEQALESNASLPQIGAAFNAVAQLKQIINVEEAAKLLDSSDLDLTRDQDLGQFLLELKKFGFDEQTAQNITLDIMQQRGIQIPAGESNE